MYEELIEDLKDVYCPNSRGEQACQEAANALEKWEKAWKHLRAVAQEQWENSDHLERFAATILSEMDGVEKEMADE